tara:strand:+ start:676 stop:1404 length:729 start_codon:yes stop_codon:yes gene_type:complete
MVPVDTVYQRVLALANKEQRGYITPQEFNLFANQVQMSIFESYFFEKTSDLTESFARGNKTASDPVYMLKEKLKYFYEDSATAGSGTGLAADVYRLESVFAEVSNGGIQECQEVTLSELRLMLNTGSDLTPNLLQPFVDRPVYLRIDDNTINVHTTRSETALSSGVTYSYYTLPTQVVWGYVIVDSNALYDASTSTNFQIHPSEETNLVIRILELAGITLNKPGLVQVANQEEAQTLQMKNS